MPTTPSPLRYPGGKTAYAPMLQCIIQENALEDCDYIEPFAGGAGAALTLLFSDSVKRIWLNDLDAAIYSFWKAILDHTEEFVKKLHDISLSVAEWKTQRRIYQNEKRVSLELGFATFYLNRCNRAGILSANPIGGLTPILNKSAYRIWERFNKQVLEEKIRKIAEFKKRINLSNEDAICFFDKFQPENKNVLVYFDPPYFQKGSLLYMNSYKDCDHYELSCLIKDCKYKWLLSYDDQPRIRELYNGIKMYRRGLQYSVSTPSVGMELLISSSLKMPGNLERLTVSRNAG